MASRTDRSSGSHHDCLGSARSDAALERAQLRSLPLTASPAAEPQAAETPPLRHGHVRVLRRTPMQPCYLPLSRQGRGRSPFRPSTAAFATTLPALPAPAQNLVTFAATDGRFCSQAACTTEPSTKSGHVRALRWTPTQPGCGGMRAPVRPCRRDRPVHLLHEHRLGIWLEGSGSSQPARQFLPAQANAEPYSAAKPMVRLTHLGPAVAAEVRGFEGE